MSSTGPWGAPPPSFLPPAPAASPVSPVTSPWAQTRPGWQPYAPPAAYPPAGTYPAPGTYPPPSAYPPPATAPAYAPGTLPAPYAYPPTTWTPAPFPAAAPARKSSAMVRVLLFVGLFVIVGPVLLSILSSLVSPTYTYTPPPPSTHVTRPTPNPATTYPTAPTTQVTPTVQYVPGTPDLSPNSPPRPRTYDDVDQALYANPLYDQVLLPTTCDITTIDLVNASVKKIETHMNQFVDCLMAAWYPPVVGAGYELPHPSVTVYTSEVKSPCGTLPMGNALYCSADQQIYYAKDLIDAFPSSLQAKRFLAESIIAHEFGHTVQYRTGILMSEGVMEVDAATDADQMDMSRRLEMQADCFAGVFLNSVSASANLTTTDEKNIVTMFTALGGTTPYDDDHGTGVNRAYWVTLGLHSTTPGICTTFAASNDKVS